MRCLVVSMMLVLCPTLALADPAVRPPVKQTPGKQTAQTSARGAGEPRSRAERSARDKTTPVQELRLRFDDDTIEAGRATGEGGVITGIKRPKHSTLISIRTSFVPELIKSAEDL